MAEQLGIINNPPYFDDFDPKKNYSKILFRPGRAVQARELTQIQSILQNQIAALGDKVLTSPIVSGGEVQIGNVKFLKFSSLQSGGVSVNPASLKGKTVEVKVGSSVARIKVLHAEKRSYEPLDVIFFTENSGYSLSNVANTSPGQSISAVVIDEITLEQTTVQFSLGSYGGISRYGNALLASLGNGIFYKDGYFVVSEDPIYLGLSNKTLVPGSTNNSYYRDFTPANQSHRVGLVLTTQFVTTETDPTLYDPSAGYYNFAAPGGDRLQIVPSLRTLSGDPNNGSGGGDDEEKDPRLPDEPLTTPPAGGTTPDPRVSDPPQPPPVIIVSERFAEIIGVDRGNIFEVNIENKEDVTIYDEPDIVIRGPVIDILRQTVINGVCGGAGRWQPGDGGGGGDFFNEGDKNDFNFIGGRGGGGSGDFFGGGVVFGGVEYFENEGDEGSFVIDSNGVSSKLVLGDLEAIVNNVKIEIIEPKSIRIPRVSNDLRLFNQRFDEQCLSDAVLVRAGLDSPLFSGVSGTNFGEVNTNYFGSGKIFKLFSDEAVRLEIVNCDGIKIGCLTALDIAKEDENSYRLYYNELQSYVASIPSDSLFAEACTISLEGQTVFSLYSNRVLTCSDTVPNGKKRLIYKIPRGNNITNVTDNDYMITRDFVADIVGTGAKFMMDVPGGVFNDNSSSVGTPSLFNVVINGKDVPLVNSATPNSPYIFLESKTEAVLNLPSSGPNTYPTAGKAYLITKVRFPEKENAAGLDPEPHRKKILREVRGVYTQNLSTNPTISLGFSDVYEVRSVRISGDDTRSLDDFIFDNGQRNDRYDHATLTLDPSKTIANDNVEISVVFRYFEHQPIAPGFYGPITVNSYGFDQNGDPITDFHGLDLNGDRITLGYNQIPNFLDRTSGEVLSLSDCIDYRMFRTEEGYIENGINKSSILRGRFFPSPDASAAVEAAYVSKMPRTDLLVLTQDGVCGLVPGVPSENPVPREYPTNGLVLAEVSVPGIATSAEDYVVQMTPMRGVGLSEMNDLQNRVRDLEVALSLKTMESRTKPQTGNARSEFLTGVVVDDFGGHYVGDVANDEYNCSMDFSSGELRSPFTTIFQSFVPNNWSGTDFTDSAKITDYYTMAEEVAGSTGVVLVNNTQATEEVAVNSFGSLNWQGYLTIDRPYNLWMDQNTKPVVRNNQRGKNDAWEAGGSAVQPNGRNKGFGTQWEFWKSLWFGDKFVKTRYAEKDRASAKNFSDAVASQSPSRFRRNVDKENLFNQPKNNISSGGFSITDTRSGRYCDTSLNFFCPEDYIIVRGYGLTPNSTFDVYFDDMDFPVSFTRVAGVNGETLVSLSSDGNGYLQFRLRIPGGSYLSGNKLVKVVQTSGPAGSGRSFASATYENVGGDWKNRVGRKDKNIDLEKLPLGRTDIFLDNEQTFQVNSSINNGLVQTFVIDAGLHPEGIILKDLSLYISEKDTSLPIFVEIRKVHKKTIDKFNIVRNSRVYLNASEVTENSDNSFTFSNPVHLTPGQYALVIRTNSPNYKIHVSKIGSPRIDSGATPSVNFLARQIPGAVSYFGSGSAISSPDKTKTIRFSIRRKQFQTNTVANGFGKFWSPRYLDPSFADTTPDSNEVFDTIFLADNNSRTTNGTVIYTLESIKTNAKLPFSILNLPTIESLGPNEGLAGSIGTNTDIKISGKIGDRNALTIRVYTERDDMSPIVDLRKLGILYIRNRISSAVTTTNSNLIERETENFAGLSGSKLKYITRRADIDLGANVVRATFEAKLPGNLSVSVYAKVLFEGDTDFDNQQYIQMTKVFGEENTARQEFKEFSYEYDGTANQKNIVSFCVKIIVLDSQEDSPNTPSIRNLSVISAVR